MIIRNAYTIHTCTTDRSCTLPDWVLGLASHSNRREKGMMTSKAVTVTVVMTMTMTVTTTMTMSTR
jgi:hypothetical protein